MINEQCKKCSNLEQKYGGDKLPDRSYKCRLKRPHFCYEMSYDCPFYSGSNEDADDDIIITKWESLRKTIQELHDNNQDKPDVVEAMHFLLNLMDVKDGEDSDPKGLCKENEYGF